MVSWFSASRSRAPLPRMRSRGSRIEATKVDFAELAPDTSSYLGQAAYLQVCFFQSISNISASSRDLDTTQTLSTAAGLALAKHQGLVAEIKRRGEDPTEIMAPFVPAIDSFFEITRGASVNESLLSLYITQGFLDDFFIRLSDGLQSDIGARYASLLGADSGSAGIVGLLTDAIAVDPKRAHFFAMCGRRLVGDTLLLAHSALNLDGHTKSDEERIEPVFTELIATHTRRMDALGLTA
ncbi:MAG: ferritin-like fold-containing protein [Mycetocola sp.]